jgi:hypothetical protein
VVVSSTGETVRRMLWHPVRQALAICVALVLGGSTVSARNYEGKDGHKQDMRQVTGTQGSTELDAVFKHISHELLDRRIPGVAGDHRLYFHWGFSASIPRESMKEAIAAIRKSNPDMTYNQARRLLVDEWKKRVNQSIDKVQEMTGLTRRQAKGLCGILYDTHLLGDYGTKQTEHLQNAEGLKRDLKKSVNRLFGNHSKAARELNDALEKAYREGGSEAERAKRMVAVLKKKLGPLAKRQGIPVEKMVDSFLAQQEASVLNRAVHAGKNAAMIAAAFSVTINGYRYLQGDIDGQQLLMKTLEDSSQAGIATTVSVGIMEKIGEKYVLTVPVTAGLGVGVATLVFDETRLLWRMVKKDISGEVFIAETRDAMVKAAASGTAAYVAVLLGASSGGPVVMAVSIGAYVITDLAINKYEELQDFGHFSLDDMLGGAPDEVRNRHTVWDVAAQPSVFEPPTQPSVFEPPTQPGVFGPSAHPSVFEPSTWNPGRKE